MKDIEGFVWERFDIVWGGGVIDEEVGVGWDEEEMDRVNDGEKRRVLGVEKGMYVVDAVGRLEIG